MSSIFDKTSVELNAIAEHRRWGPRESLDHRKLNESVDTINKMVRGVTPARQKIFTEAETPEPTVLVQFRVHTNYGDYITARMRSDEGYESPEIKIAKRYLLRRSPFDGRTREGVRYLYVTDNERIASDFVDGRTLRERQFITPSYVWGDLIYATANPLYGTSVVVDDVPVTWLAEVDGRAWAWDGVIE